MHDTIVSLDMLGLDAEKAVIWGAILRDPWANRHIKPGGDPQSAIWRILGQLAPAARGLIGEVFEEEERMLTRSYDAILKLLAKRVWSPRELSARLYSSGLLDSPNPGRVTPTWAYWNRWG